eukprot:scaffold2053_cov112-Cylindrotheca_fusiformis.AAC.11
MLVVAMFPLDSTGRNDNQPSERDYHNISSSIRAARDCISLPTSATFLIMFVSIIVFAAVRSKRQKASPKGIVSKSAAAGLQADHFHLESVDRRANLSFFSVFR